MVKTSAVKLLVGLGITGTVLWVAASAADKSKPKPKITVDIGPATIIKIKSRKV